jgi:gliding motility-associated protein GldM
MAEKKISPRQKMINLMYLVLIAMLALNMSKEVLTAFGIMNKKLEKNNVAITDRNNEVLNRLEQKENDNPGQFSEEYAKARQVSNTSMKLYDTLEAIKIDLLKDHKLILLSTLCFLNILC